MDYTHPDTRLTDFTAYTLGAGNVKTGLGLVGTSYDNAGASIPLRVGVGGGVELGTNVLYDAVGFFNMDVKWNLLDHRWAGLSLRVGIKWLDPDNVYVLPDDIKKQIGDVELFIIPVELGASFPFSDMFGAHLTIGYNHVEIVGAVSPDSILVSGLLGAREVYLSPHFTLYPKPGVALILGAQLPIYLETQVTVDAESEVKPGVIVGARSNGVAQLDVIGKNTLYFAVEMAISDSARLRIMAIYGLRLLTERVAFPLPAIDLFWRF